MNTLLRLNLFALFLVAVFDPADEITHLKVPLFVSLWIVFFLGSFISGVKTVPIAPRLVTYIFAFSFLLPLMSILWYFVRGGQAGQYDGFQYLKSFLFLTLAVIFVVKRLDAVRLLCVVLTVLSIITIVISVVVYKDQSLASFISPIGEATRTFWIGDRSYAGLSYTYVYFHSAPLLVISLSYFTFGCITSQSRWRYLNAIALSVNLIAMLCSGTRNDIIFGLLTPLIVFIWYSRSNRTRTLLVAVLIGFVVAGTYGSDVVQAMFDAQNESNAIKLAHLQDYAVLFSDPKILLFGQGLGAYFYSSAFGTETSITELTYLEFVRNFGLVIAIVYYGLLFYPVTKLRNRGFKKDHFLILAYIFYLAMSLSNPLLVSSTGLLVLSIVISKTFPVASVTGEQLSRRMHVRQQPV